MQKAISKIFWGSDDEFIDEFINSISKKYHIEMINQVVYQYAEARVLVTILYDDTTYDILEKCLDAIYKENNTTIMFLVEKFKISFNAANSVISRLESCGILSKKEIGSTEPRKILVSLEDAIKLAFK